MLDVIFLSLYVVLTGDYSPFLKSLSIRIQDQKVSSKILLHLMWFQISNPLSSLIRHLKFTIFGTSDSSYSRGDSGVMAIPLEGKMTGAKCCRPQKLALGVNKIFIRLERRFWHLCHCQGSMRN